ncbi:MAG: nucleotidyltransferase domain-containing protein [Dethiobacter sp.]|nr:nucleotidyltransferase domain-containing protein [Dethiobacter sp.]MBS4055075.1 nucleotidyltransferase domain-containing protein [Thermaerobacter sp.]
MISDFQKQVIVEMLRENVAPSFVYLFGSQSSGTARQDSDIDIAYVADKHLSPYERFTLAGQLASLLHVDVDLVDLNVASTVLQMQIVSQGSIIYCTEELFRQLFAMRVYKMYARLNEERAAIMQNYARGSLEA